LVRSRHRRARQAGENRARRHNCIKEIRSYIKELRGRVQHSLGKSAKPVPYGMCFFNAVAEKFMAEHAVPDSAACDEMRRDCNAVRFVAEL
jgi:hypothetical protein